MRNRTVTNKNVEFQRMNLDVPKKHLQDPIPNFIRDFAGKGHDFFGIQIPDLPIGVSDKDHFKAAVARLKGSQSFKKKVYKCILNHNQLLFSQFDHEMRKEGLHIKSSDNNYKLSYFAEGKPQKIYFKITYDNLMPSSNPDFYNNETSKLYPGETSFVYQFKNGHMEKFSATGPDEILKKLEWRPKLDELEKDCDQCRISLVEKRSTIKNKNYTSETDKKQQREVLKTIDESLCALKNIKDNLNLKYITENATKFNNNLAMINKNPDKESKQLAQKAAHILGALVTLGIYGIVRGLKLGNICFWQTKRESLAKKAETLQSELTEWGSKHLK